MPSQHREDLQAVTFRLEEDLVERFRDAARRRGENQRVFLARALEERIATTTPVESASVGADRGEIQ